MLLFTICKESLGDFEIEKPKIRKKAKCKSMKLRKRYKTKEIPISKDGKVNNIFRIDTYCYW